MTRFTVQILNNRNQWVDPDDEDFGTVDGAMAHAAPTYGDTYFWRVMRGDEVVYDEIAEQHQKCGVRAPRNSVDRTMYIALGQAHDALIHVLRGGRLEDFRENDGEAT